MKLQILVISLLPLLATSSLFATEGLLSTWPKTQILSIEKAGIDKQASAANHKICYTHPNLYEEISVQDLNDVLKGKYKEFQKFIGVKQTPSVAADIAKAVRNRKTQIRLEITKMAVAIHKENKEKGVGFLKIKAVALPGSTSKGRSFPPCTTKEDLSAMYEQVELLPSQELLVTEQLESPEEPSLENHEVALSGLQTAMKSNTLNTKIQVLSNILGPEETQKFLKTRLSIPPDEAGDINFDGK